MGEAKVEFKLMPKRLRDVLNGPGAMKAVDAKAMAVQARASSMFGATGYGLKPARPGRNRCHAIVYTADKHAVSSNRKHNTLSKSLK